MNITTKSNNRKGIFFAATTATVWGFLAIALKVAVNYVDPLSVVWFRFTFAFVALYCILSWTNKEHTKLIWKPPFLAIIGGIGLGFNYIGYMKGIQLTTPSSTQVIIQLAPIILAIIGLIFFKEKLSKIQATGFVLALIGFIVFYYDKLTGIFEGGRENFNVGIIIVIFAALAWVVYAVTQKILVKKYNPQSLNLILYFVPAILIIPFIQFSDFQNLSLFVWGLLIFLGLNTVIAYGCLAEAFKYLEANKVGIIITLNPMITIGTMFILSTLEVSWISPEKTGIFGLVGAILVVIGAILAVRSKKVAPSK